MLNQIDNPYIAGLVVTIAFALGFITYKILMKLFDIGLKRVTNTRSNGDLYGWKYHPVTSITASRPAPMGVRAVLYFSAGILSFIGAGLIAYQAVYIGVKASLMLINA